MPTFKLDGQSIPFEPGDSIIRAAWKQGIEVPHYCWHPGLTAPANCRMCLVEIKPPEGQRGVMLDIVEWDAQAQQYQNRRKPKLLPACQMAAVENQEVLAETSPHVLEARKYVQEALLLNHPVDCPICDQAGECKLQDYWLEHQGTKKRMRDEPVHKPKGVSFGDTIVYDGERCVMCTRCVRFMDEVALDPVLDMRERGNLNEIFVAPGRKLEGNYTFMVEHVCPVGALTTKDFRFKARVWFLRSAKSICQGCATGCNAHLDYDPRDNKAYRYRPRDNEAVNKFWMCDTGMMSYQHAHHDRMRSAMVGGKNVALESAMETARALLSSAPRETLAVVFSAGHSLEDNWALRELTKAFIGATDFYVAAQPNGADDKILMHQDKNSNRRGTQRLVPNAKDMSALSAAVKRGAVTHVLALGSVSGADLGTATIVTLASHRGELTSAATVVLPATSWAEANGTYVNAKNLAQVSEKALATVGDEQPAWQLLALLGRALGYDCTWSKLKDVRARMTTEGNFTETGENGTLTHGTGASA
jgi:NADH-quinone oxidoreductase subunit G